MATEIISYCSDINIIDDRFLRSTAAYQSMTRRCTRSLRFRVAVLSSDARSMCLGFSVQCTLSDTKSTGGRVIKSDRRRCVPIGL